MQSDWAVCSSLNTPRNFILALALIVCLPGLSPLPHLVPFVATCTPLTFFFEFYFIYLYSRFLLVIHFIHICVYMSIPSTLNFLSVAPVRFSVFTLFSPSPFYNILFVSVMAFTVCLISCLHLFYDIIFGFLGVEVPFFSPYRGWHKAPT